MIGLRKTQLRRSTFFLPVLLVLGGVLYFYNLGGWDLWNPDEPRYAEVAKEMLQGEYWVIPHLNNEVYYNKPPLFFWLIAATAKGLGEMNEFAARFPSALFALATLVLTFLLGKRLFGEGVGLFAALILATNALFFWLARRANIDATLTFFIAAAIFLFHMGFPQSRGKVFTYVLAYLAISLAVLSKLHVGLIVPLLVIGGYYLIQKEFRFFKDSSHIPGIALFVLVLGGWFFLTYMSGGKDYLQGLFIKRTTVKFFLRPAHARPIYHYLMVFPADFLPWMFFLPSALIYGLSTHERKKEFRFVLFWFSVIFVVFSLSAAKRELYLLPLYPAASVMVGYLWRELPLDAQGTRRKLISVPLLALIIGLILGAIGIPITMFMKGARYLEHPLELGLVFGLIMAVGGVLCLLALHRNRLRLCFCLIVATMFALELYAAHRLFPQINQYKSARPLSQAIVGSMRSGDQLGIYRYEGAYFNYYTGFRHIHQLEEEGELKDFLRSPQRVLCILRERDYRMLERNPALHTYFVARGQVGHRRWVVISNQ